MRKCVRCGNEIDAISKDPNKVFYCRKCSQELLEKYIDERPEEELESQNTYFYYVLMALFFVIPGTYQIKTGDFLRAVLYFFNGFVLSIFWFFILYFEIKLNILNIRLVGVNYIFSIFITINFIINYINNAFEILKNEKSGDRDEYTDF